MNWQTVRNMAALTDRVNKAEKELADIKKELSRSPFRWITAGMRVGWQGEAVVILVLHADDTATISRRYWTDTPTKLDVSINQLEKWQS